MDGMTITYAGEALDELSKTSFSVINTGRTPILKKDVASPITVKFAKEANVIDVKLDGMQPKDLGATLKFNKEDGELILEFPLFNPGDKMDFSVLAKTSNVQFDSVGRIAGVPTLVVKDVSQERVGKSRPFATYPVSFFSLLLIIASLSLLLSEYPAEIRIKSQIKNGVFELPSLKSKVEWLAWINSTFSFTTTNERKSLLQIIGNLPDVENLAILHREEIRNGIQRLLGQALSNLKAAVIVFLIAAIGGWYVFSNI